MIWDSLTRKAFEIACEAHLGQVDKGGIPYILHPLAVAEKLSTSELRAIALLHDVVEDTPLTFDDLLERGMPAVVVNAVRVLTRPKDDKRTYLEYVADVKYDDLAVQVKRADLRHNMDISRLGHQLTDKDLVRLRKYQCAYELLSQC